MHYTVGPAIPKCCPFCGSTNYTRTHTRTHKLIVQKHMQKQLHNSILDTFFHTQTHFNPRGDPRGPGGQREVHTRLVSIETLTNKIIFMHPTSHKHAHTYYTSPWRLRPHGHRPLASCRCCYCIQ